MSAGITIKQLRSTPWRVLLGKATGKAEKRIRGILERRKAFRIGTYLEAPAWFSIGNSRLFNLPGAEYQRENREKIAGFALQSLNHRFNLLGSGGTRLHYGMDARGIEGVLFEKHQSLTLQKIIESRRVESNKKAARLYFSSLPGDYCPIDWQIDFRSGYRWDESLWHSEIKYGDVRGADIKMPWEAGRMQDLPLLAFASAAAAPEMQEKCHEEFINRLLDFSASNPPKFGVQWITAMDVAIRLSNVLIAFDLFRQAGYKPDNAAKKLVSDFAFRHFDFIIRNLEWAGGARANHYLANVCGLITALAYCHSSERVDSWLLFAIVELVVEINRQFGSDGGNFEASLPYHFFAVNMIATAFKALQNLPQSRIEATAAAKPAILRKENFKYYSDFKKNPSIDFIYDSIKSRLEKIRNFSSSCLNGKGEILLIGDNDSGYFYYPEPRISIDQDGSFYIDSSYGRCIIEDFDRVFFDKIEKPESSIGIKSGCRAYPDFGLYTLCENDMQCIIRCGSIGQNGKGGHAHNDQLSFCLSAGGADFIVDPGNYVYTSFPELRNSYRSVQAHNTLVIPGMEQNSFMAGGRGNLFWMESDRAAAKCIELTDSSFKGCHKGYGPSHTRMIRLENMGISIIDECNYPGDKFLLFHFHPDIEVVNLANDSIELKSSECSFRLSAPSAGIGIEEYKFACGYGRIKNAKRGIIKFSTDSITSTIKRFS